MEQSNPLVAYLAGNASEEQIKVINEWVTASPENQALLKRLEESWRQQSIAPADLPFPAINEEEEMLEED